MENENHDKILDKLVNDLGGTIIPEKEHTRIPVDDFANGQKCYACDRIFWNENLKRIRVGIVEIDIKMNPDGKKDLLTDLQDYVVCNECYGRSYIDNSRMIRRTVASMLGIDYRTPLKNQKVENPVKEKPEWK